MLKALEVAQAKHTAARGWQLTLLPDGTTTAISPDRDRVHHSYGPPGQAA